MSSLTRSRLTGGGPKLERPWLGTTLKEKNKGALAGQPAGEFRILICEDFRSKHILGRLTHRLGKKEKSVIRSSNGAWVWSFELRPTNAHTRLISRNRFDTSAWTAKDWLGYPLMEPGSWLMERKMLLTIKQRAERLARTQTRA